MKIEARKRKDGRYVLKLWDPEKYRWLMCPGTSSYSNIANANAAITRQEAKQDNQTFKKVAHKILASKPFCGGITFE